MLSSTQLLRLTKKLHKIDSSKLKGKNRNAYWEIAGTLAGMLETAIDLERKEQEKWKDEMGD